MENGGRDDVKECVCNFCAARKEDEGEKMVMMIVKMRRMLPMMPFLYVR